MALVVEAEERAKRMRELMLEFEMPFQQVFGQRIYGPPKCFENMRPRKGCEVFVNNIPRDVYEDDIIRLFAGIGNLYQVKIMMEFSGLIRGFAYFVYLDRQTALKAIQIYHGYPIKAEHRLACYISMDNSKLYFEGLPTILSAQKAQLTMTELFDGDGNVTVFPDPHDAEKNLGIGFVEFSTHRKAAEARKLLWPSKLTVMGTSLFFEWACPLPDFNEYFVVIVLNLSSKIENKQFMKFVLDKMHDEVCICNITKRKTFATIQFASRDDANRCMKCLSGKILDGLPVKPFLVDSSRLTKQCISNIMLFLQWGVFEPESLAISSSCDFSNEILAMLSLQMGQYLRKGKSVLGERNALKENKQD